MQKLWSELIHQDLTLPNARSTFELDLSMPGLLSVLLPLRLDHHWFSLSCKVLQPRITWPQNPTSLFSIQINEVNHHSTADLFSSMFSKCDVRLKESDKELDVCWWDRFPPTFLMFSSSSCLASLAVCSSFILRSSSSCSAWCLSRRSRRFCRASRCSAGRPSRSRLTHVWMASFKGLDPLSMNQ